MIQEYNGEQFLSPETDQKRDLMQRAKKAYMSNAIMTNLLMTDDAEFDRLQDYLERFERDPENAAVPELLESIASNIGAMDIMPKNKEDNEQWKDFLRTITLDHLRECFGDNIPMDQRYIDQWDSLDISDKWEAVAGIPIKLYFSLYRTVKKDDLPTSADFGGGSEKKDLPRVVAKEIKNIFYPVDKVNSNIWQDFAEAEKSGQLRFRLDVNMAKRGSSEQAIVYYGIDFSALPSNISISKELTSFDKRVYISAAALYNSGNEYMSISQIYRKMGYTGKAPSKRDTEKIYQSLKKMEAAYIHIANDQNLQGEFPTDSEYETHRNAARFNYQGRLLPMEKVDIYINNAFTESAIHLFREPPLVSFAKERSQITTISPRVLQSPVNKTENNLMIDDYLIERISRMKNTAKKKIKPIRKILYSSIFDKCHISGKKQRQRTPEKIKRFLDHYKGCKFIRDYKLDDDGIEILL
ncbi:MAG: hypothetical protein IKQ25_09350 [Lachnospiraceae bacterium]|nr:hypothetical protein [Lachnospiraceae bacterium]